MNIHIDTAIFSLQQQGGISRLWRALLPALREAMPDATFDPAQPADWFISTYYAPAPLGVRSMALVYDLIVDKYPLIDNRADSAAIHRAITEASAVVSISQQTASDVRTRLHRDSVVAYPGVAPDFGKVLPSDIERFRAYVSKPYVLIVGRRGGYKNGQALYQAWGRWSQHEAHRILCVGGEELTPSDRAFDNDYPGVRLRMIVDDHDLQLAYAGAMALVYPSLMEGFGLPIAEALACACPVVCDHEMHEIAGPEAYYCNATIPRDIVRALDATLDLSYRMTSITTGKQWVQRYTWNGMARTIAEVLKAA